MNVASRTWPVDTCRTWVKDSEQGKKKQEGVCVCVCVCCVCVCVCVDMDILATFVGDVNEFKGDGLSAFQSSLPPTFICNRQAAKTLS